MPRAIPTAPSRWAWISSLVALVVAAVSRLRVVLMQIVQRRDRRIAGGAGVLRLGR